MTATEMEKQPQNNNNNKKATDSDTITPVSSDSNSKMSKMKNSISKNTKSFGNYVLKFKPGRSNDEYSTDNYVKRRNSHCCAAFFI